MWSCAPACPPMTARRLQRTVPLDFFVRDRAPSVRFLGNAYILPAGGEPTIPVVTINTNQVEASLFRIGDRQLASTIADGNFLSQLGEWETDEIASRSGEKVWTGTVDVSSEINREITTAIPVGELEQKLEPGAYILSAKAVNDTEEWGPKATQWFVVTDLGLTTLSGNDGLHAMVRSLGTAGPVADVVAAPGGDQQRDSRRGRHRCRGLCEFRVRPDARHRRHGARPARRAGQERRLQLPRSVRLAHGPDGPRRRRPRAAEAARRVPDDGARHLSRRRDRLCDGAGARRHRDGRVRRAADRHGDPAGRQGGQPLRARRPETRRQRDGGGAPGQRHARHLADRRLCRRERRGARRDGVPGRGFRSGAARLRPEGRSGSARPHDAHGARPSMRASFMARRPPASMSRARRC